MERMGDGAMERWSEWSKRGFGFEFGLFMVKKLEFLKLQI
jgi:hypothetical protein